MVAVFLGATVRFKGGLHGTPENWSVELEASTTYEPGNVKAAKKTWRIARPFFTADRLARVRTKFVPSREARDAIGEMLEQAGQALGQALVTAAEPSTEGNEQTASR